MGTDDAMKLSDWFRLQGVSATRFAHSLGVEPSTITRLVNGERSCSLELAIRIENATKGKVAPRELIQPEPQSREAAE